jgi:4-amino-4-deoxy-L-arabinose transferase-like glycosyltransferase
MTTGTRDSLAIFFISLLFFVVVPPGELTAFQCRFGLMAKEMLWNGPSLFPTIYGKPYPDYPGTYTFIVYLLARIFGGVTPFWVILPSAAASSLILVFIYHIGATRARKWGLCAVLVALLTWEFISDTRTISLDQYTSLVTVVCFYLTYSASASGKTRRLWLIPIMLAAGFAFRGPIGLVVPATVTCLYYLWERDVRQSLIFAFSSILVLALCLAAYFVAARAQGGDALVHIIFASQAIDRMSDRPVSPTIYWVRGLGSYALAYPLALLVIVTAAKPIFKRTDEDHRLLGHLAIWMLIVMLGLSIPAAKKMRYILPMAPAASLLAAYMLSSDTLPVLLRRTRDVLLSFFLWLPAGLFAGTIAVLVFGRCLEIEAGRVLLLPAGILLATAIASPMARSRLATSAWRDTVLVALAASAFLVFKAGLVEPLTTARESSAAFAQALESLRRKQQGDLVFYRVGPDNDDIKYASVLDHPLRPVFIRYPEDIDRQHAGAYIITSDKEFAALPSQKTAAYAIHFRGRLGHKEYVAFRLPPK